MSFFVPSDEAVAGQVKLPAEAVWSVGAGAKLARRERRGLIILFAAAAVLLFGSLGSRQLWKSEARWGQVAREMMQTGNYFRPTINGADYPDKPLVGYWLVVATAKLSGGLSEWAVRLPSVVAGFLALGATVWLGYRLWSARVAIAAGWMLLTTYGFLFYARMGMADMENVAAIMLALAWYWWITLRGANLRAASDEELGQPARARIWPYAVFYVICGVGAQTKGLTAILVPMAAILPDLVFGRRWQQHLNGAHAVGAAIGAAVYLAPFLGMHDGLKLVWRENFGRAIDTFDHDEPVYVYFYHLPILFMPWSVVLVLAMGWIVRCWKQTTAPTRWLALAMLMVFAFFTASGSRRSYYILPILPLAALLCGVSLWAPGVARKRVAMGISWWMAVGVGVASVVAPVLAPLVRWKYGMALPAGLVWSTPAIGLVALGILARRQMLAWVWRARKPANVQESPLAASMVRGGEAGAATGESTARRAVAHTDAGGYPPSQKAGEMLAARTRWLRGLALYPGLAPVVAAAAVLQAGFFVVQYPAMDFTGGPRGFAAELRGQLAGRPGPARVAVYKEMPAAFVYYMDEPGAMKTILTSKDLSDFLQAGPGTSVVVGHQRFLSRLRDLGLPAERIQRPDVKEPTMPWDAEETAERLRAFIMEGTGTK